MAGDVLQQVRLRNDFYRDSYRGALAAFILSLLVNIGLAGLCFYQWGHQPKPAYIASTADGRILPRQPLTKPTFGSEAQLLEWAQQAIIASYTYDYVSFKTQLEQASHYYSVNGWKEFEQKMKVSQQLPTAIRSKAIVVSQPTGVPTITQQGLLNGRLVWVIHMPMMVQSIVGSDKTTKYWDVTIRVQRDNILVYPKGVSISSFVATEGQDFLGTAGGA
jgi:intracellular multiplication protein IcmL